MTIRTIDCGGRQLQLDRPRIMGILNVTPDSFSDGGRFIDFDHALQQAESMLADGTDIIDVGGESTRPGAAAVTVQQEIDRVLPVIEAVLQRFDTIVSVDTSRAEVMNAACRAGVGMLNDVRALREPGALEAAATTGLPVCVMHMQGQPRTMQEKPVYADVVQEVSDFLEKSKKKCVDAGIRETSVLIDPGFGFGKNLNHNIKLLRNMATLADIAPVVVGLSRKRMIAGMLGDEQADRTIGSVMAAVRCVQLGASIVRVHDVQQTAQALTVLHALNEPGAGQHEFDN